MRSKLSRAFIFGADGDYSVDIDELLAEYPSDTIAQIGEGEVLLDVKLRVVYRNEDGSLETIEQDCLSLTPEDIALTMFSAVGGIIQVIPHDDDDFMEDDEE